MREVLLPEILSLIEARVGATKSAVDRLATRRLPEDPYPARQHLATEVNRLKADVTNRYDIEWMTACSTRRIVRTCRATLSYGSAKRWVALALNQAQYLSGSSVAMKAGRGPDGRNCRGHISPDRSASSLEKSLAPINKRESDREVAHP